MAAKRTAPPPPPPPPNPNPNPNCRTGGAGSASASPSKRMLAFHFLRALSRIHRATPVPRRTRTIRRAAYSSMARAANPRRAWSRALLRQVLVRRAMRSRRAVLLRRRVSAAPAPALGVRSISAGETSAASMPRTPPARQAGEPARADALRRLVPGGNGMEYCSLLEETADYVRCLRAQVQLMQGLVDLFSGQ
uniref:IBH1-like N-terminal domain-containing protein n=1 Tax=Arundo donax TaxID=35708 RepID=A0A0A9A6M0_ARUDO